MTATLIDTIEITHTLPCLADSRVILSAAKDLAPVRAPREAPCPTY